MYRAPVHPSEDGYVHRMLCVIFKKCGSLIKSLVNLSIHTIDTHMHAIDEFYLQCHVTCIRKSFYNDYCLHLATANSAAINSRKLYYRLIRLIGNQWKPKLIKTLSSRYL